MSAGAEIKRIYKDFIADGGDPSRISKTSDDIVGRKIYNLVRSLEMRGDDGRRFTLAEKFEAQGIPFEQKKYDHNAKYILIKLMLDEFVASGHSVEDLKKTDAEYRKVKDFKMTDEHGRRLTVEEKFSAFGHPRKAKISHDIKTDTIAVISSFLKAGGDIYMPKAKLPFYRAEYASFARSQRDKGVVGDLAFQTNMRELGFDYSELYFEYRKVEELLKFKDESGFVDSYRKDIKMDNFVKTSAYKLGLPIPVFVGLVGNCDLEGCYVDTEYFGFVRTELGKYLETHDNFVGMSKSNKPLYEKLRHIGRMALAPPGMELSTDDIVCLLGFDEIESDFGRTTEKSDVSEILKELRPIAQAKGGKLSRSDIPEKDYRKLVGMIASTGATTTAFFKLYDIDYDGKDGQRLAKVWVNGYPYMKEMRAERDRILAEHGVSMAGGSKKEDLFDVLIDASIQAFEKYKSQIFNFEAERIMSVKNGKNTKQGALSEDKKSVPSTKNGCGKV